MFGNPHEKLQAGFRGYLLAGVAEELRDWRILFDNTGVAEGARCVETHRLVNRNQLAAEVSVHIPTLEAFRAGVPGPVHLDVTRAGFHQPPRGQAALAEEGRAVALPRRGAFQR